MIQVAIDPVFQLAVSPALANKPEIMTLGGEGVPANMDLIRSGKETMAMAVPHEWAGYLGVDAVNRLLAGEKPVADPQRGVRLPDHRQGPQHPADRPLRPVEHEHEAAGRLQGGVPQGLGRRLTAVTEPDGGGLPFTSGDAAVSLRGVSKTYGLAKALDDISFEMIRGKVHALLGGNGCGKSTLIKILAGVVTADPGGASPSVGEDFEAASMTPDHARDLGLRFVHQDLGVFTDLTRRREHGDRRRLPHRAVRQHPLEAGRPHHPRVASTATTSVLGPTPCCMTCDRLTGRWWPSLGRSRTRRDDRAVDPRARRADGVAAGRRGRPAAGPDPVVARRTATP